MMLVPYESKKAMKLCIGRPLRYTETSFFGIEYLDNGRFNVAHRPIIQKGDGGREFFASVTMHDGMILKVT